MKIRTRKLVSFIVLVIVYSTASGTTENTSIISAKEGDFQIEMNDGMLSLQAKDISLHEIMSQIGELAGFKTIVTEDFVEPALLNVMFKNLPVPEAVERLVSNKNRIIFYKGNRDVVGERNISQVWLLGPSFTSNANEQTGYEATEYTENPSIASGQENVVKGYKLIKLTRMLQEDQAIQVRTRAAIALGKLQNQGAVLALESALLDQQFSVRSQAIKALGLIGSERAIMLLGNILLSSVADISERVMAAQALWKHDAESARGYLRAGEYDNVEAVRLASSSLSPPVK